MFFINFVMVFQSAKNGLKPVQRQHCKWYNVILICVTSNCDRTIRACVVAICNCYNVIRTVYKSLRLL